MAPEMMQVGIGEKSGSYGTKVDIYSLGCVYFFLSFGHHAFHGCKCKSPSTPFPYSFFVLIDERPDVLPSLEGNEGKCPPMLQGMISKCWMKNPMDRPSARQLLTKLNLLIHQLSLPEDNKNDKEKEKEKEKF